ncbi:hypothetical protein NEOKW01_1676 [Nematocida sp. AWRm80]|nr:hypothetical protein NEOKW01_1676 [Nematocida sp. AWRm80]
MNENANSDHSEINAKPWIVKMLDKIKKYIRRRPVLKYGMIGLGMILCVALVILFHLTVFGDDSSEGKGPIKDPQAQDNGNESSRDNRSSLRNIEPFKIPEEKDCKNLHPSNDKSVIVTEITPFTSFNTFSEIYARKIEVTKKCPDNLCGRCSDCSFVNDQQLYDRLIEAAKSPDTKVVLYDTIKPLEEFMDGPKDVFSNLSEEYIKYLSKQIMMNQVLYIGFTFSAPAEFINVNIPMVCSIFVEGKSECHAHRFRLRNSHTPKKKDYAERIENLVVYRGINLQSTLKDIILSICTLQPNTSTEIDLTLILPEDTDIYTVDPIIERRASEQFKKHLEYTDIQYVDAEYLVERKEGDELKFDRIEKHKLAHLFTLFGEKKKKIKPNKVFGVLAPVLNKTFTNAIDTIMDVTRKMLQVKDISKIVKDAYYMYDSVHALSALSSICRWEYAIRPLVLELSVLDGCVYLQSNGITIMDVGPIESVLQALLPVTEPLLGLSSDCYTFIGELVTCLEASMFLNDNHLVATLIKHNLAIKASLKVTRAEKDIFSKEYVFEYEYDLEKALQEETKDPWLYSFLKSLLYCRYPKNMDIKPEGYLEEQRTIRNLLGGKEEKDVLDTLYSYLADNPNQRVGYGLLILNETLFLDLIHVRNDVRIRDSYIFQHKFLTKVLRKALDESNFAYGYFQDKYMYGWITKYVAYDKVQKTLNRTIMNPPFFIHSRLYIFVRAILSTLNANLIDKYNMNITQPKIEETFFEWMSSLGRFSTVSLHHPFIYLVLDYKKGTDLVIKIRVKEKKDEKSSEIKIEIGSFEETAILEYVEVPKEKEDDKLDQALRKILGMIVKLEPGNSDSYVTIYLRSFAIASQASIEAVLGEDKDNSITAKFNIDKTQENAKNLVEQTGDLRKAKIPVTINGNISMLFAIIE